MTMRHTITLIPGDGIGPEVSHAVQEILAAAGVEILWDVIPARAEIERRGQDFMQSGVLDSIRKNQRGVERAFGYCFGGWAAQH